MPRAKTNEASPTDETAAVVQDTPETEAPKIEAAAEQQNASVLTNAQIDSEAKSMKAILDARPKRRVKLIDRVAAETGAVPPPHPVAINGYVFYIPWNQPIEVPDRVADILERQGLC